ncbi:MAG: helix-turn-helix transcriptional regulator [Rhodobacteraceae bacterium]|nr:helix-turn-helix transcriptional regulator [Paracoccaceae bacterium]
MPIRVTLDRMLAARGMRARELARLIDITEANLSLLRTGKVKGVRFETLALICKALDCQPADLLIFDDDGGDVVPGMGGQDDVETSGDTK